MRMLDISVNITLNNKSDLEKVTEILKRQNIDKPVYIIELSDSYSINFESDYEHFEIDTDLESSFNDYEFVSDLGKGQKQIRIRINRTQSPFSSDGWGRHFNSDPIETTKFFIRRSKKESQTNNDINTTFKVLFNDIEKEYTVNAVPGINKATDEKGYILVKNINDSGNDTELIEKKLFKTKSEAFWRGYQLMTSQIEQEFTDYQKSIKRKRKKK